ncbi:MAG TPA: RDD family protein [Streptosporangiaceae bacterium]|nr:RDD family protein [Streptosporangiaceae bacterium]
MPEQANVPGQGRAPGQESTPAQPYAEGPQGQPYGAPPQGGMPGEAAATAGRPISPVNEAETRVTGRRIVQYIIDAIIYSIVAGAIAWALDRGTGGLHAFLVLITVVVDIIWYVIYWALVPYRVKGQTVGMMALGIRVISMDGGPASLVQLIVRSILLVLFSPLSLLVGIITMMLSRYRQRVGDHIAKTTVVRAPVQPMPAPQAYAGAGQAGPR